jgi:hemoglobin-like flavoprotein
MTESSPTVCRQSLSRSLDAGGLGERFYELFLASSPDAKAKFANTDFERQRRVLEDGLYVVTLAAEGRPGSPPVLELDRLARRHGRAELDIRLELYEIWTQCLLEALEEKDPEFSEEVASAWKEVLAAATRRMADAY